MSLIENRNTGKRSAAPLLISIFWLISTLSAALGTGYMANRNTNIAAEDLGTPAKNETRLGHEADNPPAPAQRPLRVAALESLHLKIKSGLRTDTGSQDGLLPPELSILTLQKLATAPDQLGSGLILDYDSLFSARAPPLTA
jgi:hypothetical protein